MSDEQPRVSKIKADALREAARDLSWFGAQGNLVRPDTAWAGVQACMAALKATADRLEKEGDL